MNLKSSFAIAIVTVAACTTPRTEGDPPFEFGKLRANMNGTEFVGAFARDSIIAVYDAISGQLQIEGDRQVGGRRPLVRLVMLCTDFPKAATYPIKGMRSPVHVESYLEPTFWERLWPLYGRRDRVFISNSLPSGQLQLDTIDTVARVIRGRFEVALRSLNRARAETLLVRGAFFGRLSVDHRPGGPVRWTPLFDRDCERIRNAVSM
jgi:hypothetical protein